MRRIWSILSWHLFQSFICLFHCLLTVLYSLFPSVFQLLLRYLYCLWSTAFSLWCVSSSNICLFIFLGIYCAFWIWQIWKILMHFLNLLFPCLCYIRGNLLSYITQVIFSPQLCLLIPVFSPFTECFLLFVSVMFIISRSSVSFPNLSSLLDRIVFLSHVLSSLLLTNVGYYLCK